MHFHGNEHGTVFSFFLRFCFHFLFFFFSPRDRALSLEKLPRTPYLPAKRPGRIIITGGRIVGRKFPRRDLINFIGPSLAFVGREIPIRVPILFDFAELMISPIGSKETRDENG